MSTSQFPEITTASVLFKSVTVSTVGVSGIPEKSLTEMSHLESYGIRWENRESSFYPVILVDVNLQHGISWEHQ